MTHIQFHVSTPLSNPGGVRRKGLQTLLLAAASGVLLLASGCAVQRGQETMGAYIDDSGITTRVKSRFFDNRFVDGTAISVETLNGTVMLSGFAKSTNERNTAEKLTWEVKGVKAVKNEIAVRP
ncbi:MAG TPA: BON domain-containing protein [Burkholderiaceae bacterium]|nr:BON domain-containing protein [Burkholderiaceae bacterium]